MSLKCYATWCEIYLNVALFCLGFLSCVTLLGVDCHFSVTLLGVGCHLSVTLLGAGCHFSEITWCGLLLKDYIVWFGISLKYDIFLGNFTQV